MPSAITRGTLSNLGFHFIGTTRLFLMWNTEDQVYTFRAGKFIAQVKGPACKPYFSERYRIKMLRVPLGRGWRVMFCREGF